MRFTKRLLASSLGILGLWILFFSIYRLAAGGRYQETLHCFQGGRGGVVKTIEFRTSNSSLDGLFFLPSRIELRLWEPSIRRLTADDLACPSES